MAQRGSGVGRLAFAGLLCLALAASGAHSGAYPGGLSPPAASPRRPAAGACAGVLRLRGRGLEPEGVAPQEVPEGREEDGREEKGGEEGNQADAFMAHEQPNPESTNCFDAFAQNLSPEAWSCEQPNETPGGPGVSKDRSGSVFPSREGRSSSTGPGERGMLDSLEEEICLKGGGERDVTDLIAEAVGELSKYRSGIAQITSLSPSTLLSLRAPPAYDNDPFAHQESQPTPGCFAGGVGLAIRWLRFSLSGGKRESIRSFMAGQGEADEVFCVVENGKLARGRVWSRGNGDCVLRVTIMGEKLSNRTAEHVIGTPREGDAFSDARREAVTRELSNMGVDVNVLLDSAEHVGSAARKALVTFINPRPHKGLKKVPSSERIGVDARRAAEQITMLHRKREAMRAEWVRNTDQAAETKKSGVLLEHPLTIVLDNLRSVYNVGSIFRTAETAGVAEIITCGITPHPPHDKLYKTAFSAVENVRTRHFESTEEAVRTLKQEGLSVYAMETTARSETYTHIKYPKGTALVLGNELTGVVPDVMEDCKGIVQIPTFGVKNSLNVASACPVVVFEILRQWGSLDEKRPDGGVGGVFPTQQSHENQWPGDGEGEMSAEQRGRAEVEIHGGD